MGGRRALSLQLGVHMQRSLRELPLDALVKLGQQVGLDALLALLAAPPFATTGALAVLLLFRRLLQLLLLVGCRLGGGIVGCCCWGRSVGSCSCR